jgi:hypothetical protein
MANKPDPERVKRAQRMIADALRRHYPDVDFFPADERKDDALRVVPIVGPNDRQAIRNRGELGPRKRRRDDDAGE